MYQCHHLLATWQHFIFTVPTHLLEPLCGGDAAERGRPVEPLLRRLVELDVDALLAAGAPQSSDGGG